MFEETRHRFPITGHSAIAPDIAPLWHNVSNLHPIDRPSLSIAYPAMIREFWTKYVASHTPYQPYDEVGHLARIHFVRRRTDHPYYDRETAPVGSPPCRPLDAISGL
jgi:hypothetical protein